MNDDRLGDAPIEDAYAAKMRTLGRAIDEFFNGDLRGAERTTGFLLMVFAFGEEPRRANYLSNGIDRRDVIALMKEQIRRFEGAPDVSGEA